jgi:cell division protein FtsB
LVLSGSDTNMVRQTQTSAREAEPRPAIPRRHSPRRFWPHVMLFAASVLLMNGLFGERGLMDTIRARRAYAMAARDLDRLKQDNDALRERARLLRSDPATIESVARGELGLMRPGEILVTIKDVR